MDYLYEKDLIFLKNVEVKNNFNDIKKIALRTLTFHAS